MLKCAVCNEPLGAKTPARQGPFCSPRCRTIDLGKWLGGEYVVSRPLDVSDVDEDLAELLARDPSGELS